MSKAVLKKSWTQGLDDQGQKDVRANFVEALLLRRRLIKMLQDKVEENRRITRSKSTYENPNWAYLQADSVGYERAINDIIELIM